MWFPFTNMNMVPRLTTQTRQASIWANRCEPRSRLHEVEKSHREMMRCPGLASAETSPLFNEGVSSGNWRLFSVFPTRGWVPSTFLQRRKQHLLVQRTNDVGTLLFLVLYSLCCECPMPKRKPMFSENQGHQKARRETNSWVCLKIREPTTVNVVLLCFEPTPKRITSNGAHPFLVS